MVSIYFATWKVGEYQSKSNALTDQLVGNSPETNCCLNWRKILKGSLRTGSHKRRLCKDAVVKTSSMALDKVQWRGFAKDITSVARNDAKEFLQKVEAHASTFQILVT